MAETHALHAAPASRGAPTVHALVRTLGRQIAIPSEYVTGAVEAPAALAQVPRCAGAIEGVITLDGRMLPVVSLARWLDAAASDTPDAPPANGEPVAGRGSILLLSDGDASIGLAVDAVIGAQRIQPGQICRLFHDDRPDELFQSVAMCSDDGLPTSVLEPRRLMALAGVWVGDAGLADRAASDATATAGGAERQAVDAARSAGTNAVAHATFRIADAQVALPAAHVGELLRSPRLRSELIARDGLMGLCEWRGRLVPVVDLAGALHTLPAAEPGAWVCIVVQGELAIGIVVHEALGIAEMAQDAGTPERAPASERSVLGRRLVAGDCTWQVIDVAALLRRYPETAISADGASAGAPGRAVDRSAPAYMVFEAGGMFAARIDSVQEVIPVPEAMRARLDAGMPATLQWRQQPVDVVAIADGLVSLPSHAARQLVIVREGARLSALLIVGVKAMVPRGIALRNRIRMQGRSVEVISVDTEDHHASYPVVDLCTALQAAA